MNQIRRLRIHGVTGLAMFFALLHGVIDRILKRSPEHYIQEKIHSYLNFVAATYQSLERRTSTLHISSDQAVLDLAKATYELQCPLPEAKGTPSMKKRESERIAAIRPNLETRCQEAKTSLASIEESMLTQLAEADLIQERSFALTQKHLERYSRGRHMNCPEVSVSKEYSHNYMIVHKNSIEARHCILTACGLKGAKTYVE